MIEKAIIVTNNPRSKEYYSNKIETIFVDAGLIDVLKAVRDYVHKGHRVLTHPLMGSIKPNQTPYKTVVISYKQETEVDFDSLTLIENSIETSQNLINSKPYKNWPNQVLEDFSLIDFDLIFNALNK